MNKSLIRIFVVCLIALILMGATLLTAQQSNVPEPRDVDGTVKNNRPIVYDKGRYGGTFLDSLTLDIKTFNNTQSGDAYSGLMVQMTSPYLMDLNYDTGKWNVYIGDHKKGKTGPGYDIEVLDDGYMVVTFYLRKDIYWNDGTRMTADDWVFYHNEIVCNDDVGDKGNAGTYIELEDGDEEQIRAEKIDRWSFKLIYPRTQGEPELASNYNIMPKHILKPILDSQGADGIIEMWGIDTPPNEIVGFGPWIIEGYEPNSLVTFKRNDRYFFKDKWNSRLPYLDNYIFSISSDTNTEFLKFMNKELDVIEVTQTNFKDLVDGSEAGGYDVWNGGYETTNFFIVFNQNPTSERMKGSPQFTWFTDKRFRQAMSYLIDRETLSIQAYNGLAEPSRGLLTPASHYYDPNVELDNAFDPKKAMVLLDEMGIRDRNGDGILEDKNNNDVKFEILTYTGLSTTDKLIAIIAKEWKANGLDVTYNQLEFNTLTDRLHGSYDFDAIIIALTGSIYPTGDNVWPSDGTHHQWYPLQEEPATEWEAEIDYLYAEAKYEPDFETRRSLYMEMYSILYDQLPLIPLVRRYKFRAAYSKWGNFYWDVYADYGDYLGKRLYLK